MTAARSLICGLVLCSFGGLSTFACSGDDDGEKSSGTGGTSGSGNTAGSDASSGGSSTGGTSSGGSGGSPSGGSSGAATGGNAGATGGTAGAAGQHGDAGADACDYFDIDILLVDCNAQHLYMRRWTSLANDPNCPDFWTLEGQTQQFSTEEAALQSSNCNENCVRHASTSVTLLKCGVKSGYIVYHADNCPDVLETPDGFFSSVEEWNDKVPCADQ